MTQKMATSKTTSFIQAAQPTIKLLESLDPKAFLLRLRCEAPGCSKTFTHDVAYVLRMTRSTGFFIPSKLCRKCRKVQKKPRENQKGKKVIAQTKPIQPIPTKVVKKVVKKVTPVVQKPTPVPVQVKQTEDKGALRQHPFAGLKDLLPKKPEELTSAQKAAVTRKKNQELVDSWVTAKTRGNGLPDIPSKLLARAEKKYSSLEVPQK